MKKGIIFDLDGTLWDATEQMLPAWNKVLLRYAPDREPMTLEEVRSFMGKTVAEIAAAALPNFPEEERVEVFNRCSIEELPWLREHPGSIYPKVPEILHLLSKEYPLYIVSNCQDGYIQTFLEVTGLGNLFEDFTCSGMTGLGKGDNIQLIVQKHHWTVQYTLEIHRVTITPARKHRFHSSMQHMEWEMLMLQFLLSTVLQNFQTLLLRF